jgi:hypothetical protein
VLKRWRLLLPAGVIPHHRVENCEQFPRTGDERDLGRLPRRAKPLIEAAKLRVPPLATERRGKGAGRSRLFPLSPASTNISLSARLLSEADLNALGAEHWELAGVIPIGEMIHYYFKRVAGH